MAHVFVIRGGSVMDGSGALARAGRFGQGALAGRVLRGASR